MLTVRRISPLRRQRLLFAAALVAPAFLIMAAVTVYPLLHSLYISFLKWNLMKPQDGHPFIGFDNYTYILNDPTFLAAAIVTASFVFMAVPVELGLGILIALMLNRPFRGRSIVRMLALLPWAIPSIVNGIMWKWILNPRYGALNGLLLQFSLIHSPKDYVIWLGDPGLALFMVALADVWKETPFIMLLILAALQTVPKDLYEAALVDGAGRMHTLVNITLPLIRPTLFVALALRTIWAFKSFDLIYTLTAGGPSKGTTVIGYYTYIESFVSLNLGRGAAAAYLMTAVVMILVIFYQRSLYKEVQY